MVSSVPVNVGALAVAVAFVTYVCCWKRGSVTSVGAFAVKLPGVQFRIRFLPSSVAVSVGKLQAAAVPGVTDPPPEALTAM